MRILFVHEYADNVAGQEVSLIDRLTALGQRGLQCEVLLPSDRGIFVDRLDAIGVPVRAAPLNRFESKRRPLPYLRTVAAVAREIWRGGFDVVHCSGVYPHQYCFPAARLLGKPTVVHVNTSAYTGHCYRSSLLRQARQVITVSEEVRRKVIDAAGLGSGQVVTVLDGMDAERLDASTFRRQELRAELDIPPDRPLVGQLASLIPRKGFDILVEAAALVHQRHPEAMFLLMGRAEDEPYAAKLRARVDELGLTANFRFEGFKKDYPPYIDLLDISVLASRAEGLPRILVESQMLGKPVVAAAIDGVLEAVDNERSGLLADPEDPPSLAAGIIRLLDEPELAARLGEAAAAESRARFTLTASAKKLETIYRDLVC